MALMIGMTYPTITGENSPKGASFERILQEFPEMQLWSVYYDGTDLPSWNEEWFGPQYEGIRYYVVSVKASNLQAIRSTMMNMPDHLKGRVVLILHHEPDQWRSESDNRGDPHPDVWWERQVDFLDLAEGQPWRAWFKFAVCFTEDRARTSASFWEQHWGSKPPTEPRIDFVMFDCFNIGRSIVRQGADIFNIPINYGVRCQNAWAREEPNTMIREFGQVTPVDSPTDSTAVAQGVEENINYARTNDDVIKALIWYYNHNNTLADPQGVRRPMTRAVLQAAVADSADNQPDPSHPQYQMGYQSGRASRQDEIDMLNERLALAEQAIAQLQQDVDNAHQAGRTAAFQETVSWAAQQS